MPRRKKVHMTGAEESMAMQEAMAIAEREGRNIPKGMRIRKTVYKSGSSDVGETKKGMAVYDTVLDRKYLGVRYAIVEPVLNKFHIEILGHPFPTGPGYPKIADHRYISGGKRSSGPKVYTDLEQAERCARAAIRDVQVWFERRGIALKRSRKSGRADQTKGARARRQSGAIAQTAEAAPMPERVRESMRKTAPSVQRSREIRRLGKAGGKRALSQEMKRAQKRLEEAQVAAQAKLLPKFMKKDFAQKGARTVDAKKTSADMKREVDRDPAVQAALEDVRRIERAEGALAMEERILDAREPKKNPSREAHSQTGHAHLLLSQRCWDRYCKNRSVKALMDAYEALVIAHKELSYAKDGVFLKQAKAGLRAARAELKSRMK